MAELLIRLKVLYGDTGPIIAIASAVAVVAFFAVYFFLKKKKSLEDKTPSLEKDQTKSGSDTVVERKTFEIKHPEPPHSSTELEASEAVSFESAVAQRKEIAEHPEPPPSSTELDVSETISFESSVAPKKEVAELSPEAVKTAPTVFSSAQEQQERSQINNKSEPQPQDYEKDFFSRLSLGLGKTRRAILQNLEAVFSSGRIDDDAWDEFEEILVMSDIGVSTTTKLREKVSSSISFDRSGDVEEIKTILENEILNILRKVESPVVEFSSKPTVFMVAGVNGVGKTTSIGKIANRFTRKGKKVMVAAADTFRAAAVEQLGVWAERVGSEFLRGQTGADPSSVAYDAVSASISRGLDLLIIDTAGRVHTKIGLMEELKKLKRVVGRAFEGAPHEVLLVVDATTGQNAVEQARVFSEAIGITGIVLTKLDGTAKGGIVVAIADRLGIPVKYIGVGESLEDLREFDAEQFTKALFASQEKTLH